MWGESMINMSKLKMPKLKMNKRAFILTAGIIVLIFIIYIGLCFIASGNDFISNTTINNIDVGKMTSQEATTALQDQFNKDIKNPNLTLTIDKQEYQINLQDNLQFDISNKVEKIAKQSNNFFTRGYNYLFNHDHTIGVEITNDDILSNQISNSNILTYNTATKTEYEIKDNEVVFTKGKSGKTAELKSVIKTIKDALNDYDFKNKIEYKPVDHDLTKDKEMEILHKELANRASNATLDKNNNYAIVDGQVGASFDLKKATKLYNQTPEGKQFSVDAKIIQPKISKETLEQNLFKDVLGSYTTNVSGTTVRKKNVRLSGEKCNNIILLPGEEFSYNNTVGKRTKENGFGEAAAYLNGETVQEIGGGICQTSSTLYNAVLLSNLEVTERTNHTYVSGYVPIGRDATVSWGGPDFKFKNDKEYPIKIVMSYANNKITAQIYGTNVDNTYVKITSKQLSSTPYTTKYEDDPTLLEGQTAVKQKGTNGSKAQSWRNVYDANGNLISSKKEAYSVYKGHEEIILRGTMKAPATPTAPASDQATPATPPADNNTTEGNQPTQPQTPAQ